MDIRLESELFDDSDDEAHLSDRAGIEEDIKKVEDTIKNISRNLRNGDWTYLCRHPEVRAIMRVIITEAIKKHPGNIFKFTGDLFHSKNYKFLVKKINKQLKAVNAQVKASVWSPSEGVIPFPDTSSESSFSAKKSNCPKVFDESNDLNDLNPKQDIGPENFKPKC